MERVRVAGYQANGLWRAIEDTWSRFEIPIALTEVHLGGEEGDQVAWWMQAVETVRGAMRRGIDIRGITSWPTFGAYDWDSVLRERRGTYERGCFDISGGVPRRTLLGDATEAAARGVAPETPAPGWWRSDARVLYTPPDSQAGASRITPAGPISACSARPCRARPPRSRPGRPVAPG